MAGVAQEEYLRAPETFNVGKGGRNLPMAARVSICIARGAPSCTSATLSSSRPPSTAFVPSLADASYELRREGALAVCRHPSGSGGADAAQAGGTLASRRPRPCLPYPQTIRRLGRLTHTHPSTLTSGITAHDLIILLLSPPTLAEC